MKTILMPMFGYSMHPQYGITFIFPNNWNCYIDTTINLNLYPQASNIPPNTGGSGGVK